MSIHGNSIIFRYCRRQSALTCVTLEWACRLCSRWFCWDRAFLSLNDLGNKLSKTGRDCAKPFSSHQARGDAQLWRAFCAARGHSMIPKFILEDFQLSSLYVVYTVLLMNTLLSMTRRDRGQDEYLGDSKGFFLSNAKIDLRQEALNFLMSVYLLISPQIFFRQKENN